jgi:hypothetical protein
VGAEAELAIAPPYWTATWELFAWMGHRRFARHWSVPQIRYELQDRYSVEVSADWIEDYLRRYQIIVAAREGDLERLRKEYTDIAEVVLTIDGLQPEKGHETVYVVRELRLGRVWFAQPLLSSSMAEVRGLFERSKRMIEALGKRVLCWMSDKQDAFLKGVEEVFPGVTHRYCNNHFLRDLAKPVLEKDSHAKVQMRRKVRGLREIEKRMLEDRRAAEGDEKPPSSGAREQDGPALDSEPTRDDRQGNSAEHVDESKSASLESSSAMVAEASTIQREVVLSYCGVVRGILNDDQGGPLSPPGQRMNAALGEVQDSIKRCLGEKKGVPTTRRQKRCRIPRSVPVR